jgi:hypothetical protein
VLREDGWWDADLSSVRADDSCAHRPPSTQANQFTQGTRREGEDGQMWVVKSKKSGDEWYPVEHPEWKPPKAGDENIIYRLKLAESKELVEVSAPQVLTQLRPYWMYDRVVEFDPHTGNAMTQWTHTISRKDVKAHLRAEEASEQALARQAGEDCAAAM